jgi:hypothetical protein
MYNDTKKRLNALAVITTESEMLEKIDHKDIIENFISKNTKRTILFK